ncbi:MAG: DsbC family protein [Burkholderiaceae bacterium]|nr:DsbC family protein [Burkholderiaceae bacterium]
MKSIPASIRRALAAALFGAVVLAGFGPAGAQVADPSANVRSAVDAWLKGRYKVDEVRRTPIANIWEVRLGTDVIYVDEKGQFGFIEGNLVDLRSNRNLTRERVDELLTIDFKALPFDLAIKQVIGNGKRVFAVFEDPNCGYCKRMRKDMVGLKDATIYTFVIPILSPDSEVKAKKALCAEDKARAWSELMLSGKIPNNPGTCETPIVKTRELAQKLGVSATPTTFFSSGRRLQGYVPAAQFEKMLEDNSRS